jgi:hypothetical protein
VLVFWLKSGVDDHMNGRTFGGREGERRKKKEGEMRGANVY